MGFSKSLLTQMFIISSNGMLVNKDSMSELVTSLVNNNLMMLFHVNGVKTVTRNLAILCDRIMIVEIISLRNLSTTGL